MPMKQFIFFSGILIFLFSNVASCVVLYLYCGINCVVMLYFKLNRWLMCIRIRPVVVQKKIILKKALAQASILSLSKCYVFVELADNIFSLVNCVLYILTFCCVVSKCICVSEHVMSSIKLRLFSKESSSKSLCSSKISTVKKKLSQGC